MDRDLWPITIYTSLGRIISLQKHPHIDPNREQENKAKNDYIKNIV
jgi:hypothetical protein